jgi:hypothetical protein
MRQEHPTGSLVEPPSATRFACPGPPTLSADLRGDPDSICSLRVLPPLTRFFRSMLQCTPPRKIHCRHIAVGLRV